MVTCPEFIACSARRSGHVPLTVIGVRHTADDAQGLIDRVRWSLDRVENLPDDAMVIDDQGKAFEPIATSPECGQAERRGELEILVRQQPEREAMVCLEVGELVWPLGANTNNGGIAANKVGVPVAEGDRLKRAARCSAARRRRRGGGRGPLLMIRARSWPSVRLVT